MKERLTPPQREALDAALREIQGGARPGHRATRQALLASLPERHRDRLGAWFEAFVVSSDELAAWETCEEQGDGPALSTPSLLEGFRALAAFPLSLDEARAILGASDSLGEEGRVLALASVLSHAELETELTAELARTADRAVTWRLLDWFPGHPVLAALGARRDAVLAKQRAPESDATRWLLRRGFLPAAHFRVAVTMTDVPSSHPQASHLREQRSSLELTITNVLRGPFDSVWTLVLRGGRGEAKHGFSPSLWSGDLRQPGDAESEVQGTFEQASDSPVRRGRRETLSANLESIGDAIDAIERLTGRSFHRDVASISASARWGPNDAQERAPALEAAVRAWLSPGAR